VKSCLRAAKSLQQRSGPTDERKDFNRSDDGARSARPVADNDINGATVSGFFFSSAMVLHSLLSEVAGVISGFDLGDEIAHQGLGFGSSSNANSWARGTSKADAGASTVNPGGRFDLTLLGQYAVNFGIGADGHGGTVITDPSVMVASSSLPLVAPSHG
jgi:hypothetical protein